MLRFAELSSIWSMVRLRAHPSIWICCQIRTWGPTKGLTFQGIILFLLDSRYLGHCPQRAPSAKGGTSFDLSTIKVSLAGAAPAWSGEAAHSSSEPVCGFAVDSTHTPFTLGFRV